MTDFIPSEKGVPIRFPSNAYLNIDSSDRFNVTGPVSGESAADFSINRNLNVLNGYFTRIAVQEVYLDWCYDNINAIWENNQFKVDISGAVVSYAVNLPGGHYTVEECLNEIVSGLNSLTLPTYQFYLTTNPDGTKNLDISGSTAYLVYINNLQTQLNIQGNVLGGSFPISCPKLLPITYIDFSCPPLSQNQEVYDSTTNFVERNLLYRWWLAWENETSLDGYGYPIFQGYKPFVARRLISFPKQIKWSGNQPIGTLSFEVYGSTGDLLPPGGGAAGEFEWGMTLLASEV